MKSKLLQFFFLCSFSSFCFAQNNSSTDFSYEVNVVDAPLSISKTKVQVANTLADLNRHYKADWVKEYKSVEILTTQNGKIVKALSKSNDLTTEQKGLLNSADDNTTVSVNVMYLPENNLKQNDIKETSFSFTVAPEKEAEFIAKNGSIKQYLKEKGIQEIPKDCFKEYALAAVKFTINEVGEVINPHIVESARDEEIDALLLAAITNMPNWKPAEYTSGLKVKQEFVLTVGDMRSCTVNLLNIRQSK